MAESKMSVAEKLTILERDYPLKPYVHASRLYSTVRRMQAEKAMEIPINLRTGFAVSVKYGRHANDLAEKEWEEFFQSLRGELKRVSGELHRQLFGEE